MVGDGFDFYAAAGDATVNTAAWQSAGSVVLRTTGSRFGGNYMNMGNDSASPGSMNTAQFTNSQTLFVNMNIISSQGHVASGTTQLVGFTLRDTTSNIQCGVFLRNGGDFVLTSGAIGSGVLATSSVLMPLANQWAHIQVKIFVHNTTGTVELRINGATSASWSATGLNTRNGTSNFYANVVTIQGSSPSQDGIDDFYVFNDQSPAPSNFQGDVHAIQQFPTSDNSITWTRNTGTNNCLAVDEPRQNGDTDYVATNVVNNTDIYGLAPLSPTPSTIVAVVPRFLARMDDAGPHTVRGSLTSGGTTVNLTDLVCTGSYVYQQATYAQDPNTSAAWTASGLNACLLSIKDIV